VKKITDSVAMWEEAPSQPERCSGAACALQSADVAVWQDSRGGLQRLFAWPSLVPRSPQIPLCKKKILRHIKMSANARSTKC
jgi:hypothetical protein